MPERFKKEVEPVSGEIYLDNQSTTRVDPRVVEAMLPWMLDEYANPGSTTHEPGRRAAARVDACRQRIADHLNAEAEEVLFTSGATESINLAILGLALHPRQKRRRIVSVVTEHRAALDTIARLEKQGFEVVRLPVETCDAARIGTIDLAQAAEVIDDQTALVNVMLGNNEVGTLQPLEGISKLCREHGTWLHCDATQAVGKIPIDMDQLGIDLLSFSAHKFYGPKGMGGLIVHQRQGTIRLQPQIVGGGQQHNLRSGTLNSAGIVGLDAALEIAIAEMPQESMRCQQLRDSLWRLLEDRIQGLQINGPDWRMCGEQLNRLPGNLNVCFPNVDGQSLMLRVPKLAVSSGSACTSAEPHPSHVLRALGRSEDEARASLRFGIGRFTTQAEIEQAAQWLGTAHAELSALVV